MSEGSSILTAIIIILLIAFSPVIILSVIGWALYRSKPETAKILFIIALVYLVVGLGVCGLLMN